MRKLLLILGLIISIAGYGQKKGTHFIIYGRKAVTYEFDSVSPKRYKETTTHYYSDNWTIKTRYCNRYRYLQVKAWKELEIKQIKTISDSSYNKIL